MSHVSDMIHGIKAYTLLDDQLVAYDRIRRLVVEGKKHRTKRAVIIKGGPGTGKSVIALNLMADLTREGCNTRYATGSRAFTETLRRAIGPRAAPQFDYTNSYVSTEPDSVDAIIVDEAHRIRPESIDRYRPKSTRSGIPQVQEILKAAKLSVFLVDDLQAVTPTDTGSSAYIREHAEHLGIAVDEIELEVQFRCRGSDSFVAWIDNVLGLRSGGPLNYQLTGEFDFRIVDSPEALENLILTRSREGASARMVAGFCWPWSDPLPDGQLQPDVVIWNFRHPWNAKPNVGRIAKGVPKAALWAYDPRGIDQIGCIYTAQGFEFDYVGVIVGPDLTCDPIANVLNPRKGGTRDPKIRRSGDLFDALIRRTYRVLLSRGILGCYVFFTEPETRRFFQDRIKGATTAV